MIAYDENLDEKADKRAANGWAFRNITSLTSVTLMVVWGTKGNPVPQDGNLNKFGGNIGGYIVTSCPSVPVVPHHQSIYKPKNDMSIWT